MQNEFFYEGGLRATGIMVSAYRASSNLEAVEYTDWMMMLLTEQEYVREIFDCIGKYKTLSYLRLLCFAKQNGWG